MGIRRHDARVPVTAAFALAVAVSSRAAEAPFATDAGGVVPYWLGLGPIPVSGSDAQGRALDVEHLGAVKDMAPVPGEAATVGGREFRWKLVTVQDGTPVVDCAKSFANAQNVVAYLVAYLVFARDAPDSRIVWGSDDACAVYVNGREVDRFVGGRGCAPDQETAPGVRFRKGANTLVLKVVNQAGGWAATARLTDPAGKPLSALEIRPAPAGKAAPAGAEWKRVRTSPPPALHVNQIGYRTRGRKIVVLAQGQPIGDTPPIELADARTGRAVWTLADHPEAFRVFGGGKRDGVSGDYIAHIDLTEFTRPGRYRLSMEVDDGGEPVRSHEFEIGDRVLRDAGLASWKSFYYQRADCEKPEKYAGPWSHGPAHLGPNQAKEARVYKWAGAKHWDPVGKEVEDPEPHDVTGGWWDAGNFDKYMGNTVVAHNCMLLGVQLTGKGAADRELEIPESGNGVPDILDEVRYGTEFLIRMGDATGAAFGRVYEKPACPPEATKDPVMLTKRTSGATMNRAAALAYAAVVWRESGHDRKFAKRCLDEAMKSWKLLEQKPHPWPADPKDPRKEAYTGQWFFVNFENCRALAAACFFKLTGEEKYHDVLRECAAKWKGFLPGEGGELYPTIWVYTGTDRADAALAEKMKGMALKAADGLVGRSGFRRGYCAGLKGYWWGSNASVGWHGVNAVLAAELVARSGGEAASRDRYLAAAEEYAHYLYGRNPLGLCYLTNMKRFGAEKSVTVMFHSWLGNANKRNDPYGGKFIGEGPGKVGPPPGYVVGGPNGSIKTYVMGLDWWTKPWEYNEPCLGYQAPCAVLLGYVGLRM